MRNLASGAISRTEFYRGYVGRRPVLLKGFCASWPAVAKWNGAFFSQHYGNLPLTVKVGDVSSGVKSVVTLREYAAYVAAPAVCAAERLYLHNTNFLTQHPELAADVLFPLEHLPRWYADRWWRHTQFFWGPEASLTPMHFDSLGTHNLFFQLHGRKKFFVIPATQRKYCAMRNFFWSDVNAEPPDLQAHPEFAHAEITEYLLEPGDAIYLPPFTIHQVRGLDETLSMNIDWHTRASVLKALTVGVAEGMPKSRIKYNLAFMLGLVCGIPSRMLYPLYEEYLL